MYNEENEGGNMLKIKDNVHCIEIDLETRQIKCLGDKNANVVLYDLIQAGLVEKVKEE